ncbi:hypothetical protein B0H12DRAFT_1152248 [Mycena haematopus]|nr:hypothetical protein B0H12DRAFT_1152248 [Mycena haematopus]
MAGILIRRSPSDERHLPKPLIFDKFHATFVRAALGPFLISFLGRAASSFVLNIAVSRLPIFLLSGNSGRSFIHLQSIEWPCQHRSTCQSRSSYRGDHVFEGFSVPDGSRAKQSAVPVVEVSTVEAVAPVCWHMSRPCRQSQGQSCIYEQWAPTTLLEKLKFRTRNSIALDFQARHITGREFQSLKRMLLRDRIAVQASILGWKGVVHIQA